MKVEKWTDNTYRINEQPFSVLDRIIIQGPKSQIPSEAIHLGGQTYLLETTSHEESILLAAQYSREKNLISWPDVITTH